MANLQGLRQPDSNPPYTTGIQSCKLLWGPGICFKVMDKMMNMDASAEKGRINIQYSAGMTE